MSTDPIAQAVDQWIEQERNAARYLKLQALLARTEGGLYLGKTPQEMNTALDAVELPGDGHASD